MTIYSFHETFLGRLLLTADETALTGLYFADEPHAPGAEHLGIRSDDAAIFRRTVEQLDAYTAGSLTEFDLPLRLEGTPFQERVWSEIARIPFGATISYGELATRIAAPLAVRAAGRAAGANPIGWIVPCHRVTGKDGSLTGYAGGLPRKRLLLDFESKQACLPLAA
jgi:methylated-DNA-[protein]-cysteine S-methyltransferase